MSAVPNPTLLVCNKHDDTMSFVDPTSFQVLDTISTGPNPHEIVITADQQYALLSNYRPPGDTVSVIDLVAAKHLEQISTGEFTRIHGAAIAPDGRHAYFTAGQTGYVVEIDVEEREVLRGIPTYGEISHMVYVSPDGTRLYTANIESQDVSVLDRTTGNLITKIPCGRGVEGMGFSNDGRRLWALNQEAGTISVIDVPNDRVLATFPCPGAPVRVAFTPGGTLALVPSWTPIGELIVINVPDRRELARVPVGSQAIGIVISDDGRRAFVGCEHTDGVHVVDIESRSVIERIKTGDGSDAMAMWRPPGVMPVFG